jgi:regulatory protein YycI of two-component signal transduction system YycFG
MENFMDWSKAKTILIVAFILTNILLGVVLFSDDYKTETTATQGFIEDVTRILSKKNITIDTEVSTEIPSLNTLTIEYEMVDIHHVNNSFFNGEGKVETEEQNIITISKDNEYLTINSRKSLIYENNTKVERYKDLDGEKARDIALEFLNERSYNTSDMQVSYEKNENNSYYIEFSKIYNGRYLEKAMATMEIDKIGVKRFERIWLNLVEEGETPRYISTAPKAILSLLSMEESYGRTIKDISLCYYFDPSEQEDIKDTKNAIKGQTVPAWRVLFEDGYKIIIDNY